MIRHSFAVEAHPAQVYAHLIEPQSYVGLSPLVVAVSGVRRGPDGSVAYVAVERFRWGPFRWDNHIRVAMSGDPDERIVSQVSSPGGVVLIATVELRPIGTASGTGTAEGRGTGTAENTGTAESTGSASSTGTTQSTGTQITEILTVTSPRILRRFVIGQARKVQQHRAAELTRRMRA